ncbi:MAG: C40 family peptidase [Cytophagaceae bacterium]|jgi:hypothetical protein|nr:C40 family peptidase [Cytophagaceae bacterium]
MIGSICPFSTIPVRLEPSERAPLETQVLFGEVFYVLETMQGWCRIKLDFDGYEGWVDEKTVIETNADEIKRWLLAPGVIIPMPCLKLIREPEKSTQLISGGSRIVFNRKDRNTIVIGKREFYVQDNLLDRKVDLETVAKGFLNTSYLWGGRTFFGIDCSALVQIVFKITGVVIPRNASQQIECGTTVSFVEEARLGDLAFFDNPDGAITHTGICLGDGRILHASGEVRIDHLDHQGIFNFELHKYTHHLRVIKRIVE